MTGEFDGGAELNMLVFGAVFQRSEMASLDAARRAYVGERLTAEELRVELEFFGDPDAED
jgi:hypothetical protein